MRKLKPGQKPRVLMTASTLPRWSGDTEPDFIHQLARALAADYDVTVLAPHCPGALRDEVLDGVSIHRYRYAPEAWETLAYAGGMLHKLREKRLRWLLLPAFLLAQLVAIIRLQRQQRFDLLHAHWIVPQGFIAACLRMLRFLRVPMLLTCHGADLFSLRKLRTLKAWVMSRMDAVSVVSSAMLPVCIDMGLDRDRVFVRSMGVDLRRRFVSTVVPEARLGLVFVGRLVDKKGVDTLLRSFARLHPEFPEQQLTIVGDGPLRNRLEELARESGCEEAVVFVGAVPNAEVPSWLNRARIAVVPSVVSSDGDQEGLGLVAVEAMGCGCAVVCSDLPALEDVVEDGKTGRVFPAGNPERLAEILKELLLHSALTAHLAASGRQSVLERFDWSVVSGDYARCYDSLISMGAETRC